MFALTANLRIGVWVRRVVWHNLQLNLSFRDFKSMIIMKETFSTV